MNKDARIKRVKKTIKGNIWDIVDIEALNNEVDRVAVKNSQFPQDISYKFLKIDKEGNFSIEANFIYD